MIFVEAVEAECVSSLVSMTSSNVSRRDMDLIFDEKAYGCEIYRRAAWRYAADGFIDKSSLKEALLALIKDGEARDTGVAINAAQRK
jgi:hypothetical protein